MRKHLTVNDTNKVSKGRSVTIVAAYLMYAKGLDPAAALALIRKARPFVE